MQSKSMTLWCVAFQFGFINYEVGDSKKLFFHVKEVQDGVELQAGDEVEFSVILNQRTGKCSACNVWRVWWGLGTEGIDPGTVSASSRALQAGPAWAGCSWSSGFQLPAGRATPESSQLFLGIQCRQQQHSQLFLITDGLFSFYPILKFPL